MPEKDWHTWAAIMNSLPEPVRAGFLATLISFIRVMYDGKEPSLMRRFLESCLCGSITVGVAAGCNAMGWPSGAGVFFGAMIGFFGADQVRAWGKKFTAKKLEKGD